MPQGKLVQSEEKRKEPATDKKNNSIPLKQAASVVSSSVLTPRSRFPIRVETRTLARVTMGSDSVIAASDFKTLSSVKEIKKMKDTSEGWLSVQTSRGSVFIHEKLYNALGITAFRGNSQNSKGLVNASTFTFSSRKLILGDESQLTESKSIAPKTRALLNKFQAFLDKNDQAYQYRLSAIEDALPSLSIIPDELQTKVFSKKSKQTKPASSPASLIIKLIQEYATEENTTAVFNPERRDEVFLPFTVNKGSEQEKFGLHVYPWLSRSEGECKFSGFNQFVTAVCMFGSSLKGIDQHGTACSLIKHDIQFFPGQQIIAIQVDQPSFYEAAQFEDFEKLMSLLGYLSSLDHPKKLYCHLPYYDYMLFGVELFLRNRMTHEALVNLFQCVYEKRDEYIQEINRICEESGIQVVIASPFDNIFGALVDEEEIMRFFETLEPSENSEAILVQYCLKLLLANKHQEEHRQVWQDFMSIIDPGKIRSLEDLFKIGNAMMIAIASRGKKHYEVCSLLPLSEKQIQLGYVDHSKKLKDKYPAVVNFTYLDPFLGYSPGNKGPAFYFNASQNIAIQLIEQGILKAARKNAGSNSEVEGSSYEPLRGFVQEFEKRMSLSSPIRKPSASPTKFY